jgi:hypothetical protein
LLLIFIKKHKCGHTYFLFIDRAGRSNNTTQKTERAMQPDDDLLRRLEKHVETLDLAINEKKLAVEEAEREVQVKKLELRRAVRKLSNAEDEFNKNAKTELQHEQTLQVLIEILQRCNGDAPNSMFFIPWSHAEFANGHEFLATLSLRIQSGHSDVAPEESGSMRADIYAGLEQIARNFDQVEGKLKISYRIVTESGDVVTPGCYLISPNVQITLKYEDRDEETVVGRQNCNSGAFHCFYDVQGLQFQRYLFSRLLNAAIFMDHSVTHHEEIEVVALVRRKI